MTFSPFISFNSTAVNQVTRKIKPPKISNFRPKAALFINNNRKIRPKRLDCGLFQGRGKMFGNMVSFAENKTRRSYDPNVHLVKVYSEALDARIKVKATTAAINSISKAGGLDSYLLNTKEKTLDSKFALLLKDVVKKAMDRNEKQKQRDEEIDWYAKRLVEEAENDENLKNLILNPHDPTILDDKDISPEDMELRLKLDKARKESVQEDQEYWKQRARLIKGPRDTRRHGRYDLTKPRIQLPEYKLPKEKIQQLRSVDTVRWDLVHRGVLKYSKKTVGDVEKASSSQNTLSDTATLGTAESMLAAITGRGDQPGKKMSPKEKHNHKKEKAYIKK
ncbi:ribosomal protein L28 [Acrasis kona]|uniref:Large ribosomal subunit protein bL28m n=1 Tax=Acrasis kona TaxID=1008807 RepID=A0AAW2YZG4_9EUKA